MKYSIISLLFLICLLTPFAGTAQPGVVARSDSELPQLTGYLEILGNSGFYTINTDITFPSSAGLRLGIMPLSVFDNDQIIPNEVNNVLLLIMPYYLFGSGSNRLEVGGGFLLGEVESDWDYIKPPGITATLGYRKQPVDDKRFTFRIGLTPILSESQLFVRGGISIGWLINGQ